MWRVVVGLLAVASCGDGLEMRADAGTDAAELSELVHLQVKADFVESVVGVTVYFQASDSRLVLATTTDAAGMASGRVGPDGFVTLFFGQSTALTYSGVQPGDELMIDLRGERPTLEPMPPGGIPTLSLPIMLQSPLADATTYQVSSICGGYRMPASPPRTALIPKCASVADVLLVGIEEGLTPEGTFATTELGYAFEEAHDLGSIMVVGAFRALEESVVAVTNVPDSLSSARVDQRLMARAEQVPLWTATGSPIFEPVVDGAIRSTFMLPRPAPTTLLTQLDPPSTVAGQHVIDWRPATENAAIDWAATTVRSSPAPAFYDESESMIRWQETNDGTPGNVVRATLQVNFSGWQIVGPRGEQPQLRVPRLPSADFANISSTPRDVQTILVDGDAATVSAMRRQLLGHWVPTPPFISPFEFREYRESWPLLGERGRVVWRSIP